ncbi:MAG: class I SAM-dependent methyltransferase [Candidatus Dormibacteria bacterium]|jgi:SAM-dependent methyltransferase
MESGGREQRFVFGEVAELYDRARAGYPEPLVDDVLDYVQGDGSSLRALEVGAGTGKATVAFARRDVEIVALEPSPAMAAVAMWHCSRFPGVKIAGSTFEAWPVEASGFDLLFSAQAWHWVHPSVRYVKAAQALRAGGTLALFWNETYWHGEPLRDELDEIYRRRAPELLARNPGFPGLNPRREDDEVVSDITGDGQFADVTTRSYPWLTSLAGHGLVELLGTQSDHRLLPEERRAQLFVALGELVAAHGGEIEVPRRTFLVLARRGST